MTGTMIRKTQMIAFSLILLNAPMISAAGAPQQDPSGYRAGETIILDRDLSLRLALDQSWRIEEMRLHLRRDTYNLEAQRAGLKSNASMSFTLPNFDQSIKELIDPVTGDPIVIGTRSARYSGNITVRQPLPTNGVISLNGAFNRTSDRLFSYTPGRKAYYGRMFLRYEQPILQPNRIQVAIRRAELKLESTELDFLGKQIDIIRDISRGYFDLYDRTYQSLLADEEQQRLELLYEAGRRRFQRGDLTETDLLQLEVDLYDKRNRSSSSTGALTRQKSGFKNSLGLSQEVNIAVEPELTYTPVVIDVDVAIEHALEHRPDIRRNEMWREGHEMSLEETRSRGSVRGTVSLTLGLEGRGDEMAQFTDNILDPDQARGAAINFTVPLWDWGRNKASLNAQLADMDRIIRTGEETRKNMERGVRDVVDRVMEAQGRLELLVRSVDAAERSYRLAVQQFESGSLNVQDLLLTQGRLASSSRSYLSAYIDYRKALIDLLRNTYWDWERDQPLTRTLATFIVAEINDF
ncbi:TolC family protein [Candidatus Zixiibacteriota bacterium]